MAAFAPSDLECIGFYYAKLYAQAKKYDLAEADTYLGNLEYAYIQRKLRDAVGNDQCNLDFSCKTLDKCVDPTCGVSFSQQTTAYDCGVITLTQV
jgi:hypothetical protein